MVFFNAMDSILSYEWSCPSCTFSNKPAAFKCHVCGTPKGTATRQAKYHSSTVERQVLAETMSQQLQRLQATRAGRAKSPTNSTSSNGSIAEINDGIGSSGGQEISSHETSSHESISLSKSTTSRRKLKGHSEARSKAAASREDCLWPPALNINRSSGTSYKITVDNLTVTITEYDLLYPED